MFYEIVIAPGYTADGLEILKGKSKQLRILEAKPRSPSGRSLRQVAAGWLYQEADSLAPEAIEFKVRFPVCAQLRDMTRRCPGGHFKGSVFCWGRQAGWFAGLHEGCE